MFFILFIFLGFSLIMLFANQAERARGTAAGSDNRPDLIWLILTYGSVVAIQLAVFLGGIVAQAFGLALGNEAFLAENPDIVQFSEIDFSTINFTLIGAGMWIPALIGMLVLLPPLRRLIARVIPIDPESHVHAVALSYATLILPNLLVTIGVGLDNFAEAMAGSIDATELIVTTWLQNLGLFILGLVGVGWLSRRSYREVLQRLKITSINGREAGIGVGAGIGLFVILAVFIGIASAFGLNNPAVDELSEELYGPFFQSFAGILTVGVAAAWGEETVFRGALQPRFGRLLTALLFAILHGNYGLSIVTLGIFVVGYLLGAIRDRYNTTTAMIVHATFNMVQALLAFLALQGFIDV